MPRRSYLRGIPFMGYVKGEAPGQSSLFFGLPSKSPAVSGPAMLFGYGSPPITGATAQTPQHEKFAPRNSRLDEL